MITFENLNDLKVKQTFKEFIIHVDYNHHVMMMMTIK